MYKTISNTVYIKPNLIRHWSNVCLKFIVICDGIMDKLTNFICLGKSSPKYGIALVVRKMIIQANPYLGMD